MGKQLSYYLDQALFFGILVVAGVTPLLFTNLTTDFYETPKLMFLVGATIILLGLWILSWVAKGKIVIHRTPLDLPWLGLLAVVIASTFFSVSRYPAIFGDMTRMHQTAISWVTYVLLFFVVVSNLAGKDRIRSLLYVLLGSGVVVSLVSIFSYFRLYLPLDFARSVNFSPTGSVFSATAMLLVLLPIPLVSILKPNKFLPLPAALTLASIFGMTVALVGSIPIYVVTVLVFGLSLMSGESSQIFKRIPLYLVPVGLTALIMVMGYLKLPGNIFQQTSANFPREIQLPLGISWKVTASAFRDAPFIGTGPATYGFNFTSYKPLEFNQLNFWNVNFDTAYNEFLQVLGTLGFLGFLAIGAIVGIILVLVRKHFSNDSEEGWLAAASGVAVILMLVHATTLVSIVVTIFVFAAFMMSVPSIREKVANVSVGLKASMVDNKQFDLLPFFVFVVFLVAAVPLAFRYFNVVVADVNHRKALAIAGTSGTQTYTFLQKAEALNPYIDLYRVDLAQTNFALANAIAAQATAAAALNDQQKQTIQTLLSQAITEGRVSVALSPRSARNWEVLGSIYRNITGVAQNSLAFALDAYGKAIQRDPVNPALRVTAGGIYYSVQNYDLAIRFFSDAVNLKPDYVNGYYNLAIALRDKGDLTNAKLIADQAVNILKDTPTTPDYQTATALAKELEGQIAAGQSETALDSAQLENVEVPSLSNPPEVATPAAVRRNPDAVLPPTPTPTP